MLSGGSLQPGRQGPRNIASRSSSQGLHGEGEEARLLRLQARAPCSFQHDER